MKRFFMLSGLVACMGLNAIDQSQLIDLVNDNNVKAFEALKKPIEHLDARHGTTTPLIYAVINNKIAMVEAMLKAGANPNAQGQEGITALICAAMYGDEKLIVLLLSSKANPDLADNDGLTPLMFAADRAIAQALIKGGASLDAINKKGKTALMMACEEGHDEIVKLLLEKGARTDLIDVAGKSAIDYAKTPAIKSLLQDMSNAKKGMKIVKDARRNNHPLIGKLPPELIDLIEQYVLPSGMAQ